ncbi:MAG: hypothetical protein WA970_18360, partial [Gammaproteobacteria bacterium]
GSPLAQNCREQVDVYWTYCTRCSWLRVDEPPDENEKPGGETSIAQQRRLMAPSSDPLALFSLWRSDVSDP